MSEPFEASYGGTSESQLVRDVIYTCQGIDGEAIKYDDRAGAYVLKKSIQTPESTRSVIASGPEKSSGLCATSECTMSFRCTNETRNSVGTLHFWTPLTGSFLDTRLQGAAGTPLRTRCSF